MPPELQVAPGDPRPDLNGLTACDAGDGSHHPLADALRALSRPDLSLPLDFESVLGPLTVLAATDVSLWQGLGFVSPGAVGTGFSEPAYVISVGVPAPLPAGAPVVVGGEVEAVPAPAEVAEGHSEGTTEGGSMGEMIVAREVVEEARAEAAPAPPAVAPRAVVAATRVESVSFPLAVAVREGRRTTIVARDIHKWFGSGRDRTPIVRGVGLSVAEGETVFLVGPSGSGKTTLLSILGCILTPDQGEVRVLGHDVSSMPREAVARFRLDNLGYIFQTFNLFPTLSALDNVQMSLAIRGVDRFNARRRASELLDRVGLSHRLRTKPTRLSTGECQRVAIARALAGDPAVLLADEPTASLDAENGQAVMEMLSALARECGLTLLIVTHDNRIVPFADRILRLEDGRLVGPEGGLMVPHFHKGGGPKEALS